MHFQDSRSGMPVCWQGVNKKVAFIASRNVDDVDCADCLRPMAKDAVRYYIDRGTRPNPRRAR